MVGDGAYARIRARGIDFWVLGVLGLLAAFGLFVAFFSGFFGTLFHHPQDFGKTLGDYAFCWLPAVIGLIGSVVFLRPALIALFLFFGVADVVCLAGF